MEIMRKKVVQILKALANEKRLKILDVIRENPNSSVCEISRLSRLNYKTTSAYIRKMTVAGILKLSSDKSQILGSVNRNTQEIINSILRFERRK